MSYYANNFSTSRHAENPPYLISRARKLTCTPVHAWAAPEISSPLPLGRAVCAPRSRSWPVRWRRTSTSTWRKSGASRTSALPRAVGVDVGELARLSTQRRRRRLGPLNKGSQPNADQPDRQLDLALAAQGARHPIVRRSEDRRPWPRPSPGGRHGDRCGIQSTKTRARAGGKWIIPRPCV